MKAYPSILNSNGNNFREFNAHVFDKLDGSNLRFEWAKKSGWYKYGTRTRLFDQSDKNFGEAIPLFHDKLASGIEKVAVDNRWDRLIVFCEFYGDNSFAGKHLDEPKKLTIIDVDVYKKGIMGPSQFLKLFGHLDIPNYLGMYNWTRGFVEQVRLNEIDGVGFEGVVGKAGEGHKLIMRKAKTQAWIDKVHSLYSLEDAEKIINS
jgi:hypothetical protein